MFLWNVTTGELVAQDVHLASGFTQRLVGLLGRSAIADSQGIWFPECFAIHTVGMRVAIDVVFLDREDRVLLALPSVPQNRLAVFCRGARSVIELGRGALERTDVLAGDRFALEQP